MPVKVLTTTAPLNGSRRHSPPQRHRHEVKSSSRTFTPANISVKRGHVATQPRKMLTADNWDKYPQETVVEVQLSPPFEYQRQIGSKYQPHHSPPDAVLHQISPRGAKPPVEAQSDLYFPFEITQPLAAAKGDQENTATSPDSHVPYDPYHPFEKNVLPVSDKARRRNSVASDISISSSLSTALGAGRLDPFDVYCKQDLPIHVHRVLDHCLQHVCCSFTLAADPTERNRVKAYIMENAMEDPTTWYAIILAGLTHFIFSHGNNGVSKELRMLHLSYKTQAMIEVRKDVERRRDSVGEAALFAMNTLAAHGGASFDDGNGIPIDRIQEGKALGKANALNYYTAMETEWQHWNMFTRLMRKRGGPSTLEHPKHIRGFPPSPGPGCLTTTDVMVAWRNLRCPEFPLSTPSDKVIDLQHLERDATATTMTQKLLSGIPVMPRNNMHSRRLTTLLKKMRTFTVDLDQHLRGAAPKADVRLLYWTRLMLLHDLLLLPDLSLSDNPLELLYELCRNAALAFQQLVLVPVTANNRLPEKLLGQMLPLLERCTSSIHGRTLDRDYPSLFLWAVMLAGMLAMEHYVAHQDSELLDKVTTFFDRVPIKAEKDSWSMATGRLRNFLWIDLECDGPGRRYWNYACLWLAERSRSQASPDNGAKDTSRGIQHYSSATQYTPSPTQYTPSSSASSTSYPWQI